MRRLFVILYLLILCSSAWAWTSTAPTGAALWPVQHFNNAALLYAWAESGRAFVAIQPLHPPEGEASFFLSGQGFRAEQGEQEITRLELVTQFGDIWAGRATEFMVFWLRDLSNTLSPEKPFVLHFTANRFYALHVLPLDPAICPHGTLPVHHFWCPADNGHAYVQDSSEIEMLRRDHWQTWADMGVAFCAGVPLILPGP